MVYHGLEKWLIVHTFYNGLSYTTKMIVDAAAGGALMNEKYTRAYGLIEDMAQNHYQWTNERVITAVNASPSKKEEGMYEVSHFDHLAAKVDVLTQKFNKMSISAVSPAFVLPPCEIYGVFGHIGVDCELGNVAENIEQVNYAQYNQGMRQNQKIYKNPQNPYGQQATSPGYANNRVPQISGLKLLLENYAMNQSKQIQKFKNKTGFLNDFIAKLTSKVDSITTHNKMLETQISQVATSSHTPRIFPGQTETNPKGYINFVTIREGKQLEDPVKKSKIIEGEIESNKPLSEEVIRESKRPLDSPTHKPRYLSHKVAKPNSEAQLNKFVDMLKKIYINIPFVEALSQMPLYSKFLKDIFSKKTKIEHTETIALTKESSVILKKSPPKLRDPGSFSIPCVIGSETIDKAMCDLGASVSLLPLSLFKRIGIGELKPTEMALKLADCTTVHPIGFVEDIPVKI